MKKVISFVLAAGLIWCNNACNQEDTPVVDDAQLVENDQPSDDPIELTAAKQAEKVNADNRFAFTIFKEVSALSDEPNTLWQRGI
jgi:hypothetical protein